MAKDTDFKVDTHAPKDSPDMSPETNYQNEAWSWSRDPANFWALSANSSKMVKAVDFKFVSVSTKRR